MTANNNSLSYLYCETSPEVTKEEKMNIIKRNDLCPCGSGKKYKKCCLLSVDFSATFDEIESDFKEKGINIETPGFYDDPFFLKYEKVQPKYLNNYARFVDTKNYSIDYIKRAEKEIPLIIDVLYSELANDGRMGACLDISSLISKVLEEEGFWNYIVKGALTLRFRPELQIVPKYFWPLDYTNAVVGHAWVCAPPFNVIDIAIKQQPYNQNEDLYLPNYVLQKDKADASIVLVDDLASPEYLKKNGLSDKSSLKDIDSDASKVIEVFQPSVFRDNNVSAKYITVAITAPDSPLRQMKSICLNGKDAFTIYHSIIKPLINKSNEYAHGNAPPL